MSTFYGIYEQLDKEDDMLVNRLLFVKKIKKNRKAIAILDKPAVYIPNMDRTLSLR